MKTKPIRILAMLVSVVALTACDDSPGPLAGTWRADGVVPMTAQFRDGETEAMGVIDKVSYTVDGSSVLVTYADGVMKGTTIRYVLTDPTTAVAMGIVYHKIR